jgi:hypothetical protein
MMGVAMHGIKTSTGCTQSIKTPAVMSTQLQVNMQLETVLS